MSGSARTECVGSIFRTCAFSADEIRTYALLRAGEGTQAKLLRVLEERTVMRLGSTRSRSIGVRFLAATNRDVEADCRHGRLRPDLYFRLNGVALLIPPLRERPLELEGLVTSFLSAACQDIERSAPLTISPARSTCFAGMPGLATSASCATRSNERP